MLALQCLPPPGQTDHMQRRDPFHVMRTLKQTQVQLERDDRDEVRQGQGTALAGCPGKPLCGGI